MYFIPFPIKYKTQEMCDEVISEDPFTRIYCTDRYKTQKMCDEAVDDCLAALKFIPNWLVRSKLLEKFEDALLANDDILFLDKNFSKLLFMSDFWHGAINLKNAKYLKKI